MFIVLIVLIFPFYRDDVMIPFSNIVNNYLEWEIVPKFYPTVLSLVCRIFSNKTVKLFHFDTYDIFYKHFSIYYCFCVKFHICVYNLT